MDPMKLAAALEMTADQIANRTVYVPRMPNDTDVSYAMRVLAVNVRTVGL